MKCFRIRAGILTIYSSSLEPKDYLFHASTLAHYVLNYYGYDEWVNWTNEHSFEYHHEETLFVAMENVYGETCKFVLSVFEKVIDLDSFVGIQFKYD